MERPSTRTVEWLALCRYHREAGPRQSANQLTERQMECPMTREYERLIRLWRLAEARGDLVTMIVVQSRVGRFAIALIEGAAAHG